MDWMHSWMAHSNRWPVFLRCGGPPTHPHFDSVWTIVCKAHSTRITTDFNRRVFRYNQNKVETSLGLIEGCGR